MVAFYLFWLRTARTPRRRSYTVIGVKAVWLSWANILLATNALGPEERWLWLVVWSQTIRNISVAGAVLFTSRGSVVTAKRGKIKYFFMFLPGNLDMVRKNLYRSGMHVCKRAHVFEYVVSKGNGTVRELLVDFEFIDHRLR